jgi:Bacteriophytochrome (light-regulated signal transduction histidine kinase)
MVLIVDDRQENLFSLQKLLELHQFKVDTANSGEEALRKILKNSYFLIILDVQMPGMDGFEVAEAISGYSKSKDVPIIFLSAVNTEKRFIARGYASGGIDYITKPFDPDILLLKVKTFYRLHEQNRELNAIHEMLREEIEIRKQVEQELQQSVQELKLILESIPLIAFTLDAGGGIEYVNRYWFRYSTIKENMPMVFPGDIPVADCIKKAVETGELQMVELRIKHLETGQYRFHLLSLTPVRKNGRIFKWVCIFADIHEQRMANQILEQHVIERTRELQDANRELEASNHELQQFAYIASHDLKEPLRKIQVFSHMIREKFLIGQQEGLSHIDRVIRSSQRMSDLITDVLGYSELSVASDFGMVNINQVIDDIVADMELLIQEKKAAIRVDAIPGLEANAGQMRQVFQNILGNALKFSKDDVPPEICILAELVRDKSFDSPASPQGRYCRIQISDNGIGFDETYLGRIFSIFQRLHNREKYEGTGIGLAIVKKIIDKHNGLVTARSTEGAGSTFIIILPLRQATPIKVLL